MGFVIRLLREDGYGFIRSLEGQEIYFHRNASFHNDWPRLEVGTGVRYTVQEGDKGPQASSIEIVDKPGSRERHGEIHDLPPVLKENKKPKVIAN
jgi:cold shock CspA family protein